MAEKAKDFERCMQKYLELEALLHQFFNQVNYCKTECIHLEDVGARNTSHNRFNVGCCDGNAFLSDFRNHMPLHEKRIELYGEPKDNGIERCGYHAEEGCILKTHKPVLCLAYICPEFEEHLKLQFNIRYNYSEIKRSLSDILRREEAEKKFIEMKQQILRYINNTKEPVKPDFFLKMPARP